MHGAIGCVLKSGIPTPHPVPNKDGKMFSISVFDTVKGTSI